MPTGPAEPKHATDRIVDGASNPELVGKNYDDASIEAFYRSIYGEDCLCVGVYGSDETTVLESQHATTAMLLAHLAEHASLGVDSHVVDLGAGNGGFARALVRQFGCKVTAVNISQSQNAWHVARNKELGVSDRIDVMLGSFDAVPLPDGIADAVVNIDALMHAANRGKVVAETARILKPKGTALVADHMPLGLNAQATVTEFTASRGIIMSSDEEYTSMFRTNNFEVVSCTNSAERYAYHYRRVLAELEHAAARGTVAADVATSLRQRMEALSSFAEQRLLGHGILVATAGSKP